MVSEKCMSPAKKVKVNVMVARALDCRKVTCNLRKVSSDGDVERGIHLS